MKFASALLIAAFLAEDVYSKGGDKRKGGHDHSKASGTFASCGVNTETKDGSLPVGFNQLYQQELKDGSLSETKFSARWGFLDATTTYQIKLVNDNGTDCTDGAVLNGEAGSFSSDAEGFGKFYGVLDVDLSGDMSSLGQYIRLDLEDGTLVGCCAISTEDAYGLKATADGADRKRESGSRGKRSDSSDDERDEDLRVASGRLQGVESDSVSDGETSEEAVPTATARLGDGADSDSESDGETSEEGPTARLGDANVSSDEESDDDEVTGILARLRERRQDRLEGLADRRDERRERRGKDSDSETSEEFDQN